MRVTPPPPPLSQTLPPPPPPSGSFLDPCMMLVFGVFSFLKFPINDYVTVIYTTI